MLLNIVVAFERLFIADDELLNYDFRKCSDVNSPLTEFPYEDPTNMSWCVSLYSDQDSHAFIGQAQIHELSAQTLRFSYNIPGRRVQDKALRNPGNKNVSCEGFDIDRKDHMSTLITMKNNYRLEGII